MTEQERDAQSLLVIRTNGGLIVRLGVDGEIEYGADYSPTEAARGFWEVMAQQAPIAVRWLDGLAIAAH